MFQRTSYLMYVLPYLLFGKADIFLYSLLDDKFKVSFLSPLDRYEELIQLIVDEPIQVFHDIRVV